MDFIFRKIPAFFIRKTETSCRCNGKKDKQNSMTNGVGILINTNSKFSGEK